MPKCLHHTFDGGGLAIWRIEETADQLYVMLGTTAYDSLLAAMHNENRRAEWLAVRVLVADVLGPEHIVAYHETGRPYLLDGSSHISISHTKGFAALIYSAKYPIGMDIEYVSSRVSRVAHRFISPEEAAYMDECGEQERLSFQLVAWSAKEALYKLFDVTEGADFLKAFRTYPYKQASLGCLMATVRFLPDCVLPVQYYLTPDFVCTWVADTQGIVSRTDSVVARREKR